MNTPDPYVRHSDPTPRPGPPAAPGPEPISEPVRSAVEPNHLAVHGDPSLRREPPTSEHPGHRGSLVWIRPSELPTVVGTPVVRRTADLQAESARRLRRAPSRISRSTIARSTITTVTTASGLTAPWTPSAKLRRDEGLSL